MKILVISSYLPYPLFSGGQVRLYNILLQLSKQHEITLVCEKRNHQTDEDIQALKKICKHVYVADRKKQWTPQNIFQTGFSKYPFLLVGHTNRELRKLIARALAEDTFDVIHVETFYVMQNIPETNIPIVLVEHNVEYFVYQRFAAVAPFFMRPMLAFDIWKLKHWEKKFWDRATKLVAVSEIEKKEMGRSDVVVVPNGVDVDNFSIKNQPARNATQSVAGGESSIRHNEQRILFIGDFKWIQNRDTARFILQEVWPTLQARITNQEVRNKIKLWVVGRNIPAAIKKLGGENVIFDEHAPDTKEIFAKASLLLAPIRVGGGTSFKILEAMASGVPVVTTPLGIEGLQAEAGKDVLVGDTADTLADAVVTILENEQQTKQMVTHARQLIEKHYDWKVIVKTLEQVYKSAVQI